MENAFTAPCSLAHWPCSPSPLSFFSQDRLLGTLCLPIPELTPTALVAHRLFYQATQMALVVVVALGAVLDWQVSGCRENSRPITPLCMLADGFGSEAIFHAPSSRDGTALTVGTLTHAIYASPPRRLIKKDRQGTRTALDRTLFNY